MIEERFQVTAEPIAPAYDGERITGYVIGPTGKLLNVIDEYDNNYIVAVRPESIEPVRMKPKKLSEFRFVCPSCTMTVDVIGVAHFCQYCGMALDWPE